MGDIIRKMILTECPVYDFDRYRFNSGDIVRLDCGAVIVVDESCLNYVRCYVHKRSLKYREFGEVKVNYTDLPYYPKGSFVSHSYTIQKKLKWSVGDIVTDPTYGTVGYLYKEVGFQEFYMYVLATDNNYYLHTRVYIQNPYRGYVAV